jgi:hypothetical protein
VKNNAEIFLLQQHGCWLSATQVGNVSIDCQTGWRHVADEGNLVPPSAESQALQQTDKDELAVREIRAIRLTEVHYLGHGIWASIAP